MVRIRLTRVGLKKQASYRIIVTERRTPRDSRYLESIGFYNPRTQPETLIVDEERALYWLSVGAQPSDPVARMFRTTGTLDRFQRMKAGEPVETLVAEAQASAKTVSPKTRYPAPVKKTEKVAEE
jgi:small subunit ribosomal protein S16